MNKYKLFFTAAVFCAVIVCAAVRLQSSRAEFSDVAQETPSPTPSARKYSSAERTANVADQLENLLAKDSVAVGETNLLASPSNKSKTLRVRLATNYSGARGDSALNAAQPAKISLLSSKTNGSATSRMRALELSPTLVFSASLDKNDNLIWWTTAPDPRLFRAEAADENGVLSGETKYAENAEMLFSVPDDENIQEIRFYHPQWDGARYELKPLGGIVLDAQ